MLLSNKKNEIWIHAIWTNLKNIMLTERSQNKRLHAALFHLCGILEKAKRQWQKTDRECQEGGHLQWWLHEKSFHCDGNNCILSVGVFTGLYLVTKFSSNFTLKMGEFHCIKPYLVTVCWTDWEEEEWIPGGQLGGWGVSLSPTFQTAPFSNCFAAGESDRADLGDLVIFWLTMIWRIKSPPLLWPPSPSLAGSQGCYWVNWDLVYKAIPLPWRPISTKPKEVKQFIHRNLISLGLCFFVCKGKGLPMWLLNTPVSPNSLWFKVQCRLDLSFYL